VRKQKGGGSGGKHPKAPQQLISALLSSTNHRRLVSMSPSPINASTFLLSSYSSVTLDEY